MEIRSITYFDTPPYPLHPDGFQKANRFLNAAGPLFEEAGYPVQTARFATPPFPTLLPDCQENRVVSFAQDLEGLSQEQGFAYAAIGPALPEHPASYAVLPAVIAQTESIFAAGVMADRKRGLSLPAVRACAETIHRLAPLDEHGFANLYFTALGNVPPGAPFFPAAYHAGEQPVFALAIEGADLAIQAFQNSDTLTDARQALIKALEEHARTLSTISRDLQQEFSFRFGGIDYSLAPFPEQERSLGNALEQLGIPALGQHGSLAAAAFLADAIDRADFPRTGFSGLMLPVLEDATLASRAAEGALGIKDLLLYSAVCGTGLDTIPLPGETDVDELNALLLDLAALSIRLDKPLTARLMPIPGKQAGQKTAFDFPYFANSRVMSLKTNPLTGKMKGGETFSLKPRK
jgi:hypothetical protein